MRRASRVDGNHSQIVHELRRIGASVESLAKVGQGVPDILVGWMGQNFLFEIKDPSQVPSDRKLTHKESAWHFHWVGQVDTIENSAEAIRIMQHATS